MDRGERIPALDGLRALAALLVVLSHVNNTGFSNEKPLGLGAQGVLLFFTLSGFLMGHLYLWKPCDVAALFRYAVSRLSRVLPLFVLVVTASFAASQAFGPSFFYFLTPTDFVRELLMVGSKYVFWSIPPEVEFYVVFAGLWWALQRHGLRRCVLPGMTALAVLMLFRPVFPGITVFAQIHIFLIGVFAGWARPRIIDGASARHALVIQTAYLLTLGSLLLGFPSQAFMGRLGWGDDGVIFGTVPIALAYGAVLLAFSIRTRLTVVLLENRAMRAIGAWSFSLYLLHEPVMRAVYDGTASMALPRSLRLGLAILASLGAAKISHMLVEVPGQHLARTWSVRLWRWLEMRRELCHLRHVGVRAPRIPTLRNHMPVAVGILERSSAAVVEGPAQLHVTVRGHEIEH